MKFPGKFRFSTLAATVIAGAISTSALAQSTPVTRFDNGYLDHHPEVANQLAQNPSLADNSDFLARHPHLREFLANHPEVRRDLKEHPYRFMAREDRRDGRPDPVPLANADRYLDQHPEVAGELAKHPRLIDDPAYLEHHPELRDFLHNHPEARAEWKSHPWRFEHREARYDRTH